MGKEQLKEIVCRIIDENKSEIEAIAKQILDNPELGYKEFETAQLVKEYFNKLGIPYRDNLAITGVKGRQKGRNSLVTVSVLGEMDAVICRTHPSASKATGASHACGHNLQVASMLAVCGALSKISGELDGDVCYFAVPAEEFIEMDYRKELIDSGKIEFCGGKQELIRIGEFDDIDMAMMVHAQGSTPQKSAFIDGGSLGFLAKTIGFYGKAAHAGGAPYEGINALNAANLCLAGINAQRETFKDEDSIRVHPIITKGGDIVNVVPDYAEIETYVRGKTLTAIDETNEKVNRAAKGAAYIIGAKEEIKDLKGYLPLNQNRMMSSLFCENAKAFIAESEIYHGIDMVGSSDVGDLSQIMPVIQPTMGGFFGNAHAEEFAVADFDAACILPAKVMAMTVIDLLYNNCEKAKEILDNFEPALSKQEYIEK